MFRATRLLLSVPQFLANRHTTKCIHISQKIQPVLRRRYSGENKVSPKQTNITNLLTQRFKPTTMQINDISGGCGQSFQIIIVSDEFKGLTAVTQQRLVYAAIKQEMGDIHALALTCMTVDEYTAKKNK
jgi:stress-induced morphogen